MTRKASNSASTVAPATAHRAGLGLLQRKCACGGTAGLTDTCEDCQQEKLQRKASDFGGPRRAPGIVLEVLRSPGQVLDGPTRSPMETLFAHRFSNVRIHSDSVAAASADAVHALAYTVGPHVVFAAGQYAPQSRTGQALLAHELTHVKQQAQAGVTRPGDSLIVEAENSSGEREAEHNAGLVAATVSISAQRSGLLARQPKPSGEDKPVAPEQTPDGPKKASSATQAQPTGPQLPTCNMQAVDQWITDPQNPKKQVFGLTQLSGTGGTQPDFKVQPASGGKGVVVSPTSASLPPIQSKFMKAGRYLDKSMLNFRPDAESGFPTQVGGYLNVWEITAAGSARLQAGEQEHCDDFKLAFYMSLYRFAEIVNDLAKKSTVYSSEADARAALATQVAIDPANLPAYFGCVAGWMQNERDKKGWHTPALPRVDSISYDSTVRQQVAIRKLDGKALPEVGKHGSWDLLLNGAAPACINFTTLSPAAAASPSGGKQTGGSTLQRRAKDGSEPGKVPAIVHNVLRSPGEPLDSTTRSGMEARFGHDFSRVRVHTDANAAESARRVNAVAYTAGDHIVFEAEQFKPQNADGKRLLAHELAHVIQQEHSSGNEVRDIAPVDDASEREAALAEVHGSAPLWSHQGPRLSRSPKLSYTKGSPVQGQCGDYVWQVKWVLDGANEQTNGFIVQKAKAVFIGQNCDDKIADTFHVWWEAWQVKNGKIMSGTSERESLGDEFTSSNTMGTKGTQYSTGAAKFMENYSEPFKWGKVKQAGSLPATTQQPGGWSESGSKYRYIGISDYFCCDGQVRAGKLATEESEV